MRAARKVRGAALSPDGERTKGHETVGKDVASLCDGAGRVGTKFKAEGIED